MAKRLKAMGQSKYASGFTPTCHRGELERPYRWRKPRTVFVCSMGDLFHESVPDGFIMDVWRVIGENPLHTFIVLTKRSERARDWMSRWADTEEDDYEPKLVRGPEETRKAHKSGRAHLFADMIERWGEPPSGSAYPTYDWMDGMIRWPVALPNVWFGATMEHPDYLFRLNHLRQVPAVVRFVSMEPLLGTFADWFYSNAWEDLSFHGIHQVIVGAETGPGKRTMDEEVAERILKVAKINFGAKCFFKKNNDGSRLLRGRTYEEWPEERYG